MTKTRETINSLLLSMVLIPLFAMTISGCMGRVDGHVFFDENTNGVYDEGEPGASYIKIKVNRDDKLVAESRADENGKISMRLKRGYVCIQVNELVETAEQVYSRSATVKSAAVSKATDTSGADSSSSNTGTTSTGTSTDATDDDADKEDNSAKPVSKPKRPEGMVKPGMSCVNLGGHGTKNAEIALQPDFEAAVSDQPDVAEEIETYPEGRFLVGIILPPACTLNDVSLSKYVYVDPNDRGDATNFDPGFSIASFPTVKSAAILDIDDDIKATVTTVPVTGKNKLELVLKVVDAINVPLGETKFTIDPVADCGSKDVVLTKHPVKIVNVKQAHLTASITSLPVLGGEPVEYIAILTNIGKNVIDQGSLIFTVEPPGATLITEDQDCMPYVPAAEGDGEPVFEATLIDCPVANLPADGKETRLLKIRPPSEIEEATTFEVTAEFVASGLKEEVVSGSTKKDVSSIVKTVPFKINPAAEEETEGLD